MTTSVRRSTDWRPSRLEIATAALKRTATEARDRAETIGWLVQGDDDPDAMRERAELIETAESILDQVAAAEKEIAARAEQTKALAWSATLDRAVRLQSFDRWGPPGHLRRSAMTAKQKAALIRDLGRQRYEGIPW